MNMDLRRNTNVIYSWTKRFLGLSIAISAGCTIDMGQETGGENVAPVSQAVVLDNCPFPQQTISFDKELVIRDVAVVEDQCRTTWDASMCAGNGFSLSSLGKWTFKHLVTSMAGTNNPAEFVGRWLSMWEREHTNINGFPALPPRHQIRAKLIDPWIKLSGGPNCGLANAGINKPIHGPNACLLDLNQAPFRLLAIIPRLDLAGSEFYAPADPGSTGELRFVFGAVNLDQTASTLNGALQALTIFEYKLPSTKELIAWAYDFNSLSWYSTMGTRAQNSFYKDWLEQLTDQVVTGGRMPGVPNGSAIGQVRTNEIDFDGASQKVWEFREHKLTDCAGGQNSCFLALAPVAKTPDNSLNRTATLDTFLTSNENGIATESYEVPEAMETLRSFSGSGLINTINEAVHWSVSGAIASYNPLTRHLFGLGTCNGCHYAETNTPRVHVQWRRIGQRAPLSNFLQIEAGADPIEPADLSDPTTPMHVFSFTDPMSGESREYNEPWRRACEIRRILSTGGGTPHTKPSGAH